MSSVATLERCQNRAAAKGGFQRKIDKLTRRMNTLKALVAALEHECRIQRRVIARLQQKGGLNGK